MEEPDDLDDLTELARGQADASESSPIQVWSPDDSDDRDDVTSVLDRDSDDLDDVTSVLDRSESGTTSGRDEIEDDVTEVSSRRIGEPNAPDLVPVPNRLTASARLPETSSLRDRVPESVIPWQPPDRPRSPEFQVPPERSRRSLGVKLAVLIAAIALALAVAWAAWPSENAPAESGDPAGLEDSQAESTDPENTEPEVDDAN